MRELFREFYQKEKINFSQLPEDVLVVLDANVLLHIFRFTIESREKLFNAMEKVSGNLWIPYIAALEYHFNKQSILKELKKRKESLFKSNIFINSKDEFIKTFNKELDSFGNLIGSTDEVPTRNEIKEKFAKGLDDFFNNFQKEEVKKEFDLLGDFEDKGDRLSELLANRIGEPPTQDQIDIIEKEGEERYSLELPPGYEDNSKIGKRKYGSFQYRLKYGDLIIWKSIIAKAKNDEYNKVVFISDDIKPDWIYETKGESVGPRAELKKELWDKANCDLYILGSAKFISETISENNNSNITKSTKIPYKEKVLTKFDKEKATEFYKSKMPYFNTNGDDLLVLTDMAISLEIKCERLLKDLEKLNNPFIYSNSSIHDNLLFIKAVKPEINKLMNEISIIKEELSSSFELSTARKMEIGSTFGRITRRLMKINSKVEKFFDGVLFSDI